MDDVNQISDWTESPEQQPEPSSEPRQPKAPAEPPPAEPKAAAEPAKEPAKDAKQPEKREEAQPVDERDEKGRFRQRHRARSQQASPEDVPRIAALTKQLRETQAQFEAFKREREEAQAAAKKVAPPPERPKLPDASAVKFEDKEPDINDFADQPDPYASWLRAVSAYDRKKEAFERYQERLKQHTEQSTKQHDENFKKWTEERQAEHDARLSAYLKTAPDAVAMMDKIKDMPVTPIIVAAIELSEQGPQFMHALAKNPELVDELYMLTDGKQVGDPLNNPLVAIVQRRLSARMQAAQVGSAAQPVKTYTPAPRPLNPLRTAPQTPSDQLPDDDDSLEAHERAFVAKRR
ncbi:MAG TPA: hypothetical protein VJ865_11355 [Gemmatimonadaceae bacterium]|nr:hypothetical protein [Gemmatimonadaceae bacterium]